MIKLLLILIFVLSISLVVVLVILFQKNKKTNSKESNYQENLSELKSAYSEVDEKVTDFESSVLYAKRMVDAIFKIGDLVEFDGLEYFLMYRPKDIISGDFVWHNSTYDRHYFVVADCTGHGVPGAFMSIVSHNLLNQAVKEYGYSKPSEILEFVNKRHYELFNENSNSSIQDGMDLAICIIDTDAEIVEYSGAMRPLYLLRENGELERITGDKMSIGESGYQNKEKFTDHVVDFSSGDSLFLTSDGFVDQFGGPDGKKYKSSRFKELLISFQGKSAKEQHELLENEFQNWIGDQEQIDDVTVLGIKCVY
ncbi:serine/threonine-protein phosphatase [Paracrocinitomix mangrovi]|uniref:PP2C family protein-serine/threonine phosphatase n=1 Tax=Paracrocinitomix mangrovi TaxID=2862509 RepID=UPI001C8F0313|nr:PP2C family protein-serine/threonine phosphatase [Paracrocinitomix mangrovi]UKN01617.1 serine/threonine-protein phosphatase [Paracrocinitomix mangrovi]